MAGRKKKFSSSKALKAALQEYLDSISRTVDVTERVPTEQRDDKGHVIYRGIPVTNDNGEKIRTREYLVPPTVTGLCLFLEIHRATWAEWCDHEKRPELAEATEWMRDVMRAWNEEQLLTRKDVKGIMFNLQNNFEYTQKVEVESGPKTREAAQGLTAMDKLKMLRQLRDSGELEWLDGQDE